MSINNRLDKLETKAGSHVDNLPPLKTYVVKTKEQADHPERFRAVLNHCEVSESGAICEVYHYERI